MKALLPLLIAFLLLLSGCRSADTLLQHEDPVSKEQALQTNSSIQTSEDIPKASIEPERQATDDAAETDSITPYQFLNLMAGNADEISFNYTVYSHETKETGTGAFYKAVDQYAAVFTATDMNGTPITVRELETNGRVFYVMDHTKTIKSYLAPAQDFLITELMTAAMTTPEITTKDGYFLYIYSLPFVQDEQITFEYVFYMKDGALRKLTYSVDGTLSKTYEFSEFAQKVDDKKVFEYPNDYNIEKFDEAFTGEHMPPWWENDGLS